MLESPFNNKNDLETAFDASIGGGRQVIDDFKRGSEPSQQPSQATGEVTGEVESSADQADQQTSQEPDPDASLGELLEGLTERLKGQPDSKTMDKAATQMGVAKKKQGESAEKRASRLRQVQKTIEKHQGKSPEDLASEMTVPQLKQVAAQLGLKGAGNKANIAGRIADKIAGLGQARADAKTKEATRKELLADLEAGRDVNLERLLSISSGTDRGRGGIVTSGDIPTARALGLDVVPNEGNRNENQQAFDNVAKLLDDPEAAIRDAGLENDPDFQAFVDRVKEVSRADQESSLVGKDFKPLTDKLGVPNNIDSDVSKNLIRAIRDGKFDTDQQPQPSQETAQQEAGPPGGFDLYVQRIPNGSFYTVKRVPSGDPAPTADNPGQVIEPLSNGVSREAYDAAKNDFGRKSISELRQQFEGQKETAQTQDSSVRSEDRPPRTKQVQEARRETEETPAPETEAEAPQPPKAPGPGVKKVDLDNDSLIDAIGREGGMSFEEGRRIGLDEADMKEANRTRPGRQPFRKTTDRTAEDTAESMTENGFLQEDRDTRELADKLADEFRGDKVFSTQGNALEKQALADEFQREQDRLEQEQIDRESAERDLQDDGFDPFDPEQNPDAFSDDDGFGLEQQSEADLARQERERLVAKREDAKKRREEEQRAKADEEVGSFTLTGSDRQVDEGDARGQQDLTDDSDSRADTKEVIGGTSFLSGVPTPEMIKKLLGPMFVGSKAELDAWTTQAKDLIGDLRERFGKSSAKNAGKIYRRIYNMSFGDLDRASRALADKYNSKTMKAVADAFHHTAGGKSDGFTQQTLSVRRNKAINKFNSRFAEIDKKLKSLKLSRRDRKAQDRIFKMLENPKLPRKGELGKAVSDLEKLFKDLRDYQVERGIDVGYVEGFVPRWLDRSLVGKNKTGFVNKATEAYQSMGSDRETAKLQAAALYDAVLEGDTNTLGQNKAGNQAGVDSTKARKLSKEAAAKLDAFWQRDISQAVSSYIHAAIRRGEVADTEIAGIKLGDNAENWSEIRAKIEEEDPDVSTDDLARLEMDVAYHTGLAQTSGKQGVRAASATFRTVGSMMMLDRVAISAFPEMLMGPIRATSGNPAFDVASHARNFQFLADSTARKLARTISGGLVGKDQALQDAYDLAEYLGATAGDAISYSMQARMMGEETGGRILTQVSDRYFRNVGLTQLNDFSRVLSLRHANRFMAYLARDHGRGGRSKNRTEVQLRDLGIPRGSEGDFSKWYAKNFAGTAPTAGKLEALRQKGGQDKNMVDAYDRAVQTFVDQAIQRPDSSTRPRWADSPLGAMVFQLLNFTWAFQKNVINRAVRTVGNNELDPLDRALMGGSFVVGGAALTGAAALGNALREELDEFNTEVLGGRPTTPGTPWREAEKAISYSGLTGRLDPFLQMYSGTRYQRSIIESLAGPSLGSVGELGQNILELATQNSDNTNTAQRSAVKSAHQVIITPIAQAALAGVPLAGPAGRALVMGGAIGGVRAPRDPFIDATAGEEDPALQRRRLNNPLKGAFEPDGGGGGGSGRGRGGSRAGRGGGSRGGR